MKHVCSIASSESRCEIKKISSRSFLLFFSRPAVLQTGATLCTCDYPPAKFLRDEDLPCLGRCGRASDDRIKTQGLPIGAGTRNHSFATLRNAFAFILLCLCFHLLSTFWTRFSSLAPFPSSFLLSVIAESTAAARHALYCSKTWLCLLALRAALCLHISKANYLSEETKTQGICMPL